MTRQRSSRAEHQAPPAKESSREMVQTKPPPSEDGGIPIGQSAARSLQQMLWSRSMHACMRNCTNSKEYVQMICRNNGTGDRRTPRAVSDVVNCRTFCSQWLNRHRVSTSHCRANRADFWAICRFMKILERPNSKEYVQYYKMSRTTGLYRAIDARPGPFQTCIIANLCPQRLNRHWVSTLPCRLQTPIDLIFGRFAGS